MMRIFKRNNFTFSSLRYFARNVCVRFAPSPTGQLHIGGLRTAMYNYLFAKQHQGRFILRIEDTDQARTVPGALENIQSILKWIKLNPTEGPSQGGPAEPYIQSERVKLYNDCAEQLINNGTAYRCFCTESRLALMRKGATRLREVPRYDNRCKSLSKDEINLNLQAGKSFTVRFNLTDGPLEFEDLVYGPISFDIAKVEGDPIILKSDKFPTYHLACVVDDHFMEVTHVLRGVEWQTSTPKHIMLYKAFGWEMPKFAHLPLIMNQDGTKLSKRHNNLHVQTLKSQGYYPEAILNFASEMGGGFGCNNEELRSVDELVDLFSLDKINVHSCRMQLERLDFYNKAFLNKTIESESQIDCLIQELKSKVVQSYPNCEKDMLANEKLKEILLWSRFQGHIITLGDLLQPEFAFIWESIDWTVTKLPTSDKKIAKDMVEEVIDLLRSFDKENFTEQINNLVKKRKFKPSHCFQVIRLGMAGRKEGPPVVEIINILGVDICTKRLMRLQQHLEIECRIIN